MTDSTRWYAVPGYGRQLPTVVNAAGELVCTCEELADAETIAADHNVAAVKNYCSTAWPTYTIFSGENHV